MTQTFATDPRTATAERLIAASVDHSFDPHVDIDWQAPLLPDTFFMPEQRVSLYGTPLWQQMSRAQRIELSKHEVASMTHIGIWFEVILMDILARHIYDEDVTSKHVHFAFTELADECRHSTMFGMLLDKLGTPNYHPQEKLHRLGKLMWVLPQGPATWAAILLGEELIDTAQREAMRDETIQPIVRDVTRIHVIEEARHVRWAREEIERVNATIGPKRREIERFRIAMTAFHIATNFIHPQVYASVGLDVEEARRQVRVSTDRRETTTWMASRLVEFLRGLDLIGGPSERIWRKAGLI